MASDSWWRLLKTDSQSIALESQRRHAVSGDQREVPVLLFRKTYD